MRTSARTAVEAIPDGASIYISSGASHPESLVPALIDRCKSGGTYTLITSLLGPLPEYCSPNYAECFRVKSFRGTVAALPAIASGQIDIVPAHLSAIPRLLRTTLRPDVALIQVSRPDDRGWCSLGVSVLYSLSAIESSTIVIAEVNPQMPRTEGDSLVHVSALDYLVPVNHPLVEAEKTEPQDADQAIAKRVVQFVPDGSTVQVGMGRLSEAVLGELQTRRDIRVHSGLLSDGILGLIKSGALADEAGAVVTGGLFGSADLYSMASNRNIDIRRVEYTHDVGVLRSLDSLVSVNSALEIDFAGQINAENVAGAQISGPGGQLDFVRGAAASGGLAIFALSSTSRDGKRSTIVPQLTAPATVTTPRSDVDVVITEFGTADLRGVGLSERRVLMERLVDPHLRGMVEDASHAEHKIS